MKNKKLNRIFAGGFLSIAAALFLSAAVPAFGAGDTQNSSSDVISVAGQEEATAASPETVSQSAPESSTDAVSPTPGQTPAPSSRTVTETPQEPDGQEPDEQEPDGQEPDEIQTLDWTPGWNLVNGKYYYYLDDGTMVRSQWLKVGIDWYYFNDDGTMKAGEWFQDGIDWYYFRDWGGMMYNQFFRYEGNLYYFRSWGGRAYSMEFQVNGKSYKANADGTLVTGWSEKNGKYYYYNADGSLYQKEGWLQLGTTYDTYYYINADGSRVQSQWLKDGIDWYYLNDDGTMKSGEWFQDGIDWYYFRDWGGMMYNQFLTYEGNLYYFRSWGGRAYDMTFQANGKWYVADSNGIVSNSGWVQKNGKYYYYKDGALYQKEGWLQLGTTYDTYYYINADGSRVQGQWLKDGIDWYYLNDDGTMKSGEWFQDGIDWYYLRDWGGMMYNQFLTYEGKQYYFRSWGGMMYSNRFQVGDRWYVADANGVVSQSTGWIEMNGKYYYCQEDGTIYRKQGWLQLGDTYDTYYYINADGSRVQGQWLKDGIDWYYLNDDGTMKSGEWFQDGIDKYYFRNWGGMMYNQFLDYEGNRYFFRSWGGMMYNGKFQFNGKSYKANSDGTLVKGWSEENGKNYYYDDQYALYQKKGWLQLGTTYDTYYYFNADGSRVEDDWVKDGIDLFHMNADGTMKSDEWYKEGNDWYYFRNWGAAHHDTLFYDGENTYYFESDCKMARGWYEIGGYTYYFRDWGAAMNIPCVIDGVSYVFDSQGHLVKEEVDAEVGVRTIKNFLKNALLPVGNTLYIWAGGHDDEDASRYGVNPQWKAFFDSQDETYNYTQHRYEYGNGLDCSGYVGWAAHQVMEDWATTTSTIMPQYYYEKGWGSYKESDTSMKFQTGDVVSMSGHVWIVIGQCSDGSAVIMHATPPYVQISGTVSSSGSTNSEAIQLANKYMSRYYPVAYERYGCKIASKSYMTGINHFTWSTSVLKDPDGYRNMTTAQILADLFGE